MIQKAMEDIRRDENDYFLDLYTLQVVILPVDRIQQALSILYHSVGDDYERGVELDSEVNLDAELPDEYEEVVEMAIKVLTDTQRYVRIPERSSSEAFKVMRSFTSTVRDPSLREKLLKALNGAGAFRRFKDVLLEDKKERKKWHGYNAKAMKRVIDQWLKEVLNDS
jgi:hypothetical protein